MLRVAIKQTLIHTIITLFKQSSLKKTIDNILKPSLLFIFLHHTETFTSFYQIVLLSLNIVHKY